MNFFLRPYVQLVTFFILVLLFTSVITPDQYPDHESLLRRLKEDYYELNYTLQNLIISTLNYLNENKNLHISNYNNFTFFLPTFILCFVLINLSKFWDKNNFKYETNEINFDFLSVLCFPSVLLSITSISAEAIYTVISIYIASMVKFSKGPYCMNFISVLLLSYIFFLDKGNFMVMSSFLVGYLLLSTVRDFSNLKFFSMFVLLFFLVIFIFGSNIFAYIGLKIEAKKIIEIISTIEYLHLENISFENLILRLGYFWFTLLSLNFGDKKVSFLAIICILLLFYILISKLNNNKKIYETCNEFFINKYNQVFFIWLFVFPILFINVLPTHAYGKYFLFYLVFLIKPMKLFFKNLDIYVSIILFSVFSIFERLVFL